MRVGVSAPSVDQAGVAARLAGEHDLAGVDDVDGRGLGIADGDPLDAPGRTYQLLLARRHAHGSGLSRGRAPHTGIGAVVLRGDGDRQRQRRPQKHVLHNAFHSYSPWP